LRYQRIGPQKYNEAPGSELHKQRPALPNFDTSAGQTGFSLEEEPKPVDLESSQPQGRFNGGFSNSMAINARIQVLHPGVATRSHPLASN
jgi:hypothetical protein